VGRPATLGASARSSTPAAPGATRGKTHDGIYGKRTDLDMHYPHRISKVKRARKLGFRARMRTKNGRKTINAKRRAGRKVQVV
jgi:large subunit ribosomal protein L34